MDVRSPRLSHRPLVVAVLVVATAFGGSLWLSLRRLRPIEQSVLEVSDDALPGMEFISQARARLRALRREVDAARAGPEDPAPRAAAREAVRGIDQQLTRYATLPFAPGERPRFAAVRQSFAELRGSVEELLAALEDKRFDSAAALRRTTFEDTFDAIGDGLQELTEINTGVVEARMADIQRARLSAERATLELGMLSAVLAIVTTVLAGLSLSSQARLADERNRSSEDRARELEAFAGRVAHDLKGPLGVLGLRLSNARRYASEARVIEALDKGTEHVQRLGGVIDGLLDFAISGARPEPGARAELALAVDEVAAELRSALETNGVVLAVDAFEPVTVACSPAALSSIVGNLVRNAAKFVVDGSSAAHRVTVRAAMTTSVVRVAVEDTGPGLPLGLERAVFEPFVRARETRQAGTGLGLATVKRLVEAYGGQVGVVSRPGHGATFWFELPRAADEVTRAAS